MMADRTPPRRASLVDVAEARATLDQIREQVERVIVGKRAVIDRLLVALLAEGHVLLEDVPGTGKTKLAHSLSLALGGSFHRVQFTADLLPSDITGSLIYEQAQGSFTFHPGPVFANIVLADELNRAGPRTQAALLEAMAERQVSVERITHPLPSPFLVIATQNPVELVGTFPLPEAQLDRFFLSTTVGYPESDDELRMLQRFREHDPLVDIDAVTTPAQIEQLIATVRQVHVGAAVDAYVLAIVRRTREDEAIELGASPRATLALARAGQAHALLEGRDFVMPDDVREMAVPVLSHRLMLAPRVELLGKTKPEVLMEIVRQVPIPVEDELEFPDRAGQVHG
ncbi:MAG TPA: MoxR family ATPase [Rhodanobacter sp.]|nr:MoxR family ATPase [Rhodanobacter sp.]